MRYVTTPGGRKSHITVWAEEPAYTYCGIATSVKAGDTFTDKPPKPLCQKCKRQAR